MRKHSPAFQFYPNDWLASTNINLMTPAEEGAYIRLLAYMWNDPDCTLPNNIDELIRLSRLNEKDRGDIRVVIKCLQPFPNHPIEKLYNERLFLERKKQEEWSKKSSEGGKKGAKSRWGKGKKGYKGGYKMVKPWLQNGINQNMTLQSSTLLTNIYSDTSIELELSKLLLDKILLRDPKYKLPDLQKWAKQIDLLIRIDKRDIEEVRKVIVWCQKDDFWQNNILSAKKLREQFSQLVLKMNELNKTHFTKKPIEPPEYREIKFPVK